MLGLTTVILTLVVIETVARLMAPAPGWISPYYLKMSQDFPLLDELIRDNQKARSGLKYYDQFVYAAAPISLNHINFTEYYSARLTPDSTPLSVAKNIVWTFGGSTMENMETVDELTIANTWARLLNQAIGPTHVKNFGTTSFFSSFELIKFQKLLREVPSAERPTVAIFYDGYNDANHALLFGAGQMQKDMARKLQALVEHKEVRLWSYLSSNLLSRVSKFWEHSGARLVASLLFYSKEMQLDEENLERGINIYVTNVRMIEALCAAFDIQCLFVLQPLLVTKTPLTPLEEQILQELHIGPKGVQFVRNFYNRVRTQMAGNRNFIDASHILNGRTQPDFYDFGHTAAQTSSFIGEQTAQIILDRIVRNDGRGLPRHAQEQMLQ